MARAINLFQNRSTITVTLERSLSYLRIGAYSLLGITLTSAVILVALFLYVSNLEKQFAEERKAVVGMIAEQADKEVQLYAIRNRVNIIKSIFDSQFVFTPLLDVTLTIAKPPKLATFTIGEKHAVAISVKSTSFDDLRFIATRIIDLSNQGKIVDPVIQSITMDGVGAVTANITYTVVLAKL